MTPEYDPATGREVEVNGVDYYSVRDVFEPGHSSQPVSVQASNSGRNILFWSKIGAETATEDIFMRRDQENNKASNIGRTNSERQL